MFVVRELCQKGVHRENIPKRETSSRPGQCHEIAKSNSAATFPKFQQESRGALHGTTQRQKEPPLIHTNNSTDTSLRHSLSERSDSGV